jgi:hypothetical protein
MLVVQPDRVELLEIWSARIRLEAFASDSPSRR